MGKEVPTLVPDAHTVRHQFGWAAVTTLLDEAVRAAQDLKDLFVGRNCELREVLARTFAQLHALPLSALHEAATAQVTALEAIVASSRA